MGYRFTRQAEDDLVYIYVEGVRLFGIDQAETYQDKLERSFELLVDSPRLARERLEIDPPIRVHPCGAHLVIYRIELGNEILIVRVRHRLEDWLDQPI